MRKKRTKIPTPEKYLTTRGKRYYRQICEFLIESGTFEEIDKLYVSIAADSFDRYFTYVEELRKYSPIQVFPNGTKNHSPEYTILKKEYETLKDACNQLGLHTKARAKNKFFDKSITDETVAEDPIRQMMKKVV